MRKKAVLCPVCGGTGKVPPPYNGHTTAVSQPVTCHGCGGKGYIVIPED